MNSELSKSQTRINLMRAFAGECQARTRYAFAAQQAENQNLPVISMIFKFTAEQEKEHAEVFYNFLKDMKGSKITADGDYPVDIYGTVLELLRSAQSNESEEADIVYPDFAAVAAKEGFMPINAKFNDIAKIERSHSERFGIFADLLEQGKLFVSDTEEEWICLNCGHIHRSSEAPKSCPVCSHPQGYFIRLSLAPYTERKVNS